MKYFLVMLFIAIFGPMISAETPFDNVTHVSIDINSDFLTNQELSRVERAEYGKLILDHLKQARVIQGMYRGGLSYAVFVITLNYQDGKKNVLYYNMDGAFWFEAGGITFLSFEAGYYLFKQLLMQMDKAREQQKTK